MSGGSLDTTATGPISESATAVRLGIAALGSAFRRGEVTLRQDVDEVTRRIDSRLGDGVWISRVRAEDLTARREDLERRRPDRPAGPLWGVPFAVKDNIDVAGLVTTAACPAFAYTATRTAPAVQRLLDAGAVLIGKTNLDQFATGLSGTRSPYGACESVFGGGLISGGSSSGSAVAVAAGLVSFSLGTDTAGSGRVPAAMNGIVGLKPTRGLVSTTGVVPACRSLDCVSVFATTVLTSTRAANRSPSGDSLDLPWWTSGDTNAFFGLGFNVLVNVLVRSSLCLTVVHLSTSQVYKTILPALGIQRLIDNVYYTFLARRLARREGRTDVAAMPYGPSVPHMFIVTFVIMLPAYLKTHDPVRAWEAGLALGLHHRPHRPGGAFVGPYVRKWTPRAALLGALAGVSIAFISMRPAAQMWQAAWIALPVFFIILIGFFTNLKLPGNIPVGLAALLLATAIPLGVYNFTEGMTNVESAAVAGDRYNLRSVLLADGTGAIVGAALGSPFPPAVYIGHPGWKEAGGRTSYSMMSGVVIALLCFLGMFGLLAALLPIPAIVPILLYIGLLIGAQAFQAVPKAHAPAVVIALIPNVASWAQGQMSDVLAAAGTTAQKVDETNLVNAGVIYSGLEILGNGAILAGLVLRAIVTFIIDRDFVKAAIYCCAGAVLAFVGLIHAEQVGMGGGRAGVARLPVLRRGVCGLRAAAPAPAHARPG
jgi:AGZA family xanthine/uracil permease-like MFS transporter